MFRVFFYSISAIGLGVALVFTEGYLPLRSGLLGLLIIVIGSATAKLAWRKQEKLLQQSPGEHERELLLLLLSGCFVFGYLVSILIEQGVAFSMHSRTMHNAAINSWTMVLAVLISYGLLHERRTGIRDERDELIKLRANYFGYTVLCILLVAFILFLGFANTKLTAQISAPLQAHILIVFLILTSLAQWFRQIAYYRSEPSDA